MSNWPLVALDDVFEIARGGSPRPIDSYITEDPGGINWIMIGDASEGFKYITGTRKRIRPEGAKRSRRVQPGDFLLTNSMSFGKPYIMRTSGCIHDGWLVLSPRRTDVDADFFYHLLGSKALYSEFERRASGATVKNLNIDLVKGVRIALPPPKEQRRIAEILDQADCGPSAAPPSLNSTPSARPSSSTCSTTQSQIRSVGRELSFRTFFQTSTADGVPSAWTGQLWRVNGAF